MLSLFSDPFLNRQSRLMNALIRRLDDDDIFDDDDNQVPTKRTKTSKKQLDILKPFSWTPYCDLKETDDSFELEAELPGIPKENVNIQVDDRTLTISGKKESVHKESNESDKKEDKNAKKDEKNKDKDKDKDKDNKSIVSKPKYIWHSMERTYGSFSRSYVLPENADVEHITAKSQDGVLIIKIPKIKKELKKPRIINITQN